VTANSTPNGMRRLPTQEDLAAGRGGTPRERALRLTRDRLFVVLGVAAIPAGLAARPIANLDGELVFAVLWLGAAIAQAPGARSWPDRLALVALLAYVVSFVLPAGPADPGSATSGQLLGYQVLGMPPVAPLPHLPEGELVEIAVGLSAWLANPMFLIALACYRYREAALTMVLGVAALVFGAMELPAADIAIGHAAWLAAPALLVLAARWARADW
jgi:hypothetical protein